MWRGTPRSREAQGDLSVGRRVWGSSVGPKFDHPFFLPSRGRSRLGFGGCDVFPASMFGHGADFGHGLRSRPNFGCVLLPALPHFWAMFDPKFGPISRRCSTQLVRIRPTKGAILTEFDPSRTNLGRVVQTWPVSAKSGGCSAKFGPMSTESGPYSTNVPRNAVHLQFMSCKALPRLAPEQPSGGCRTRDLGVPRHTRWLLMGRVHAGHRNPSRRVWKEPSGGCGRSQLSSKSKPGAACSCRIAPGDGSRRFADTQPTSNQHSSSFERR